ncbi:MAG: ABC transporter ATP-binding protein [Thermoplasmatota archaeon]
MEAIAETPVEAPRPAVLELRNVSRRYRVGDHVVMALDGVNMRVERGEMVSVMGPSGSGKSTLLHLMGALDRPSAGAVLIDGHDVRRYNDTELARLRGGRIGFVFQAFNLYPTLTAQGNVELPMMALGVDPLRRAVTARRLLQQVGLGNRLGHLPSQLSGGQKQRVAIARALANKPAYILADEPTGNLDSRSGAEILQLLKNLNDSGTTVMIVTHDPSIAQKTQRTIRLLDGHVVPDPGGAA